MNHILPNSPDPNLIKDLWDVQDKKGIKSMEAVACNIQDINQLPLTTWSQIPETTFRESMF